MGSKAEMIRELVKDKATWERVLAHITRAVQASFHEDRRRRRIVLLREVPTEAEVKRRTNICYDTFAMLRADCGYSTERALDMLPRGLRAKLDGEEWEPPPAKRAWAPQEAQ